MGRIWRKSWVLLAVGVAACAPQIVHWAKPGTTYDQYLKDRYACIRDAKGESAYGSFDRNGGSFSGDTVVKGDIFKACMAAAGYVQAQEGFGPPADGIVWMK